MEAKELRSIVMFKPVCLVFWAFTFALSSSASASSIKGSGSLVLAIPLAVTSSQNAIRGVNTGEDDKNCLCKVCKNEAQHEHEVVNNG